MQPGRTASGIRGAEPKRADAPALRVVQQAKPAILCVDDEQNALTALERVLRSRYEVVTASSGRAAYELLGARPFAAIISDLRMPGMDGVQLLAHARELSPETVRVLLSGQADLDAAIKAINEGQLFRFVLKPCDSATMLATVGDAVAQHRLITAERELLEQTVTASIGALVDLLAITQPESFGRAARLKRYVEAVASELGLRSYWALGVAAQLSQVGYIIVPKAMADRARRGEKLNTAEQELMTRLLPFAEQLVASIPRLEPVRAILKLQYDTSSWLAAEEDWKRSATILRTVLEFDTLDSSGLSPGAAITRLEQEESHDPETLDALRTLCGLPVHTVRRRKTAALPEPELPLDHNQPPATIEVVEDSNRLGSTGSDVTVMPLSEVREGMHFAADVIAGNGVLLVARGQEVTASLVQRIAHSWSDFAGTLQVHVLAGSSNSSAKSTGFQRVV